MKQIILLIFTLMTLTIDQTKSQKLPDMQKLSVPVNGHELKILSWNIYMLPHCSWVHKNCKRARAIAKKPELHNYNIIVFEEAFDYKARRILRRQLRDSFPYMYGPANESFLSFRTNSGIWIMSKIPLRKLEEIEFKHRCGIDAMARKGAVLFEGEWYGQKFQIAGTHLQADSPDEIRREQCRQIADDLLKKYSKVNVPQIVCGDFNIEFDDTQNYHYMLNTLEAQNGSMEGDVHTSFDEIDNKLAKRQGGRKQLIDYVLIRNGELIKNIRRRISVFKEFQKDIISDLSDHYGIEARIQFEIPDTKALSSVR